jgi:DNA-directed RNA polymerase subunit N (RpoN/RPB10)
MVGFPSKSKGNIKGETAKQPHPGIPLNKDQVQPLIKRLNGNLSKIADSIGTTRGCVRRLIDKHDDLRQELDDSRERVLDELEDVTWQDAIDNKDPAMRCFLLKTRGKHRGYDQDDNKNIAKDIASAAFDYIVNKSKQQPTS